ncbi:hypothetical protein LUZ60_007449 [Juncus effusus]|nr:hypothetical protein LUZ60_007449 [Juncus effusus]
MVSRVYYRASIFVSSPSISPLRTLSPPQRAKLWPPENLASYSSRVEMPQSGGGGKLTPNLDQGGTKVLNLTVLQRIDPSVEDILITASHVTLYDFNIDLNQWSRKDVEGSLFVVKRNTQPRFQFIVMNRRNTENLVEDLLGDFEYEVQPPYLLYRNATQEVNGIWFYNQTDCEAVANLFGRILTAYSKVPPKAKVSSTKSEFEELEAVPNSSTIEGPLEPPMSMMTSATALSPEPNDEVLANFFSAATNINAIQQPTQISMRAHQPIPPAHHEPPSHQLPPSIPPAQHPPPPLSNQSPFATSSPAPLICAPTNNNLLTPSFFQPASSPSPPLILPVSSAGAPASQAVVPPPQAVAPVTRPAAYAAPPLLQPFPPPAPPPSLAPPAQQGGMPGQQSGMPGQQGGMPGQQGGMPGQQGVVISRDKVREALARLVQNEQFIDMVYREIVSSHYP